MENFNIISKKENPLFKRNEVKVGIHAKVTPSNNEVEKLISEKFKTQEKNIKIKKISSKFGSNNFIVSANIYDSYEDKDKIEAKTKKEKEAIKKAKEEAKTEEK
ncbi:MAG: hypothetical protein QF567_02175 [Candidatus Pacearchaeota archaeon]|jgi:ribosomal protein S24E|nr:hypothetical protein [Candidatus Pacearchaeota archaeon]MDP7521018.1 hypothetical protein [Candidatus Pacearchaeota archaeon]|tara:strand:- start:162 stop:473 length:312 start_codon:yes stop_codon:yes gene_type:complete